jgi:ribonuclease J
MGVDVYDKSRGRVHVSGHASAEELKLVLAIVHPKAFAPVHGEATHLRAHAKLAEAMGVDSEDIFILENGDTLVMKDGVVSQGESVQAGIVYVDGLSVGDTSQSVLDERVELGSMGIASVSVAVSFARKAMIGNPVVEMRGITGGDTDYLSREAARVVANAVQSTLRSKDLSMRLIRKAARDAVGNMLWDAVKQRPMVIVNILEV